MLRGDQALARLQQPDVPDLQDSSTCGGLSELYGTIVKQLGYRERTREPFSFELAVRVCLDHD